MEKKKTTEEKFEYLKQYIQSLGSVAVAFSGGVDSAFLISTAHEVLGDKAIAITSHDAGMPGDEFEKGVLFCRERRIEQFVLETDPLELEAYRNNQPDRCYHCKKYIFGRITAEAAAHGIANVAEGSNMDDLGDYRPGMKAISEMQILSPLREAGLYKAEIRQLSREMGLPEWDNPAAACLASRFAYGETITREKLRMVDKAELFLRERGFRQSRVRVHGNIARIELQAEDISRLADEDLRLSIYDRLKELGFDYVTLDLRGYRMGSMNETLRDADTEQK
jgi:uncharacterized protein